MNLKSHWDNIYQHSDLKLQYDNWLDKYQEALGKSKNTPVVDLGCGIGNNTLYLTERDCQVVSCDFSQHALAKLQRYIPSAITQLMDMTQGLPFDNQSAQVVIADLSLHYFDEETTFFVLNEIHRVLLDRGHLLCRVNSVKDSNYGGKETANEYYYKVNGIFKRFFDESQIQYFFKSWKITNMKEYTINRYGKIKRLWEIAAQKY